MRPTYLAVLLTLLGTPFAEGQTGYRDPAYIPRLDVAAGYNFVRSNAPPANCNCFGMNGGFLSAGVAVWPWLAAAAEVSRSHGNNIGPLGQNLTLTTYTAGPRLVVRASRFRTFAQATFGAAHGSDSYFPGTTTYSTSATSFAYALGGGLDYHLSHSIDVRPAQVQYLHTGFPNGTGNSQRHLVLGAGIVVKFHGRLWEPGDRARHKAARAIHDADRAALETPPPPPSAPVALVPVAPVQPAAAVEPSPVVPSPPAAPDFHASVPDVYFDYAASTLRPDAEQAVKTAATWLTTHPDLRIEIGGYADERGTQDYNLTLAAKRAEVTRSALAEAGVANDRMITHSYGKLVQTCNSEEESCYRQNRRAAFKPRP